MSIFICGFCKKEVFCFPWRIRRSKCGLNFCSKKCFYQFRRAECKCQTCGKIFFIERYNKNRGRGKFCSKRCAFSGIRNPKWNGGKKKMRGYIMLRVPDHPHAEKSGYILEHRLVMEQKLGRLLKPTEVVHHINGNPSDNRMENLQLYESNSQHQLGEDAILRFVKENYGTLENLQRTLEEDKKDGQT